MKPILQSEITFDKNGAEYVKCTFIDEDGIGEMKTISYEDYIQLLDSSKTFRETASFKRLGGVPQGFYDGCISNDGSLMAFLELKADKRFFSYANKPLHLNFPRLLFAFSSNSNHMLVNKCVFSIKGTEPLSDETILCSYPFGNVQAYSGDICYGEGKVPPIHNFNDFMSAIEVFLSTKTVNHYYGLKPRITGTYQQHELIDMIKKRDSFPEEQLRVIDQNEYNSFLDENVPLTVGVLIEQMIKKSER